MSENRKNEIGLNELEDVNGGYVVSAGGNCIDGYRYQLVYDNGNFLKEYLIDSSGNGWSKLAADAHAANVSMYTISKESLRKLQAHEKKW